jgi:tetratricopeptide (TPR) repeat protein
MPTAQSQSEKHAQLTAAAQCAEKGDYEGAIAQLKGLIGAQPRHELAIGMLAGIYAQIGMHDRAIEHFRKVLAINPDNALARLQLGLSQLTSAQPAEAIETWKPALKSRDDFLSQFYSGLALMQIYRPDEARTLLREAEKRMPKDHVLYPQLIKLLASIDPPESP